VKVVLTYGQLTRVHQTLGAIQRMPQRHREGLANSLAIGSDGIYQRHTPESTQHAPHYPDVERVGGVPFVSLKH
jgi:hypothetical protein